MTGAGRPLRFLIAVGFGWITFRIVMLWPQIDSVDNVVRAIVPIMTAGPSPTPDAATTVPLSTPFSRPTRKGRALALYPVMTARPRPEADRAVLAPAWPTRLGDLPPADQNGIVPGLPVLQPAPPSPPRSRLSGSAWALVRHGKGIGAGVVGGQIGGSQAGVRLAYALDVKRRVGLAARLTSPLGPGQRELALGIEWQPTRLPVRLVAEQRIAIGQGRHGPTLGVVGGAGPLPVWGGFKLESYAQAGIIARDRAEGGSEGFADGAFRLARPLATLGKVRFDLGTGAWGAAQKDAARLDIGPSLTAVVPLGTQPVRLSLDWRQRVAGDARPGSGLTLTLGTDF